ncbi:acyltransferase [Modicisalibacter luteus]|uniref:Acyltransferase n=1 Tax=Modicisalibacter luteus TaxID=453962 RepID=A0ABV7LXQ7_9GAMM|nr:acyltransferase [Halomonas lutea]
MRLVSYFIGMLYFYAIWLLNFNNLSFHALSRFESGIKIRLRNKGSIRLGKCSTRGRVTILADGGKVSIGDNVFMNSNSSINCLCGVAIGSGTLLGNNVNIYDHDHKIINGVVKHKAFDIAPVEIGSNCWLGTNVTVLKGVKIIDEVIIGANSVVTKDLLVSGVYVMKEGTLKKIK